MHRDGPMLKINTQAQSGIHVQSVATSSCQRLVILSHLLDKSYSIRGIQSKLGELKLAATTLEVCYLLPLMTRYSSHLPQGIRACPQPSPSLFDWRNSQDDDSAHIIQTATSHSPKNGHSTATSHLIVAWRQLWHLWVRSSWLWGRQKKTPHIKPAYKCQDRDKYCSVLFNIFQPRRKPLVRWYHRRQSGK